MLSDSVAHILHQDIWKTKKFSPFLKSGFNPEMVGQPFYSVKTCSIFILFKLYYGVILFLYIDITVFVLVLISIQYNMI